MKHTLKHHTFLCKHWKHTNTNSYIPVENSRVSIWPWAALDTGSAAPSYINGPFLSDGGKPHTQKYTHSKHRHTLIGQTPHVLPRSILSSVNVRPWERGFILEWDGIFTPFITASLLHTHLGFPTLPTQFNSLCIMHNTTLRHPLMSLQLNIKTSDRAQHHNKLFKVNKSPNLEILWVYSTFGWTTLNSTHPVYMCKLCH